MNRASRYETGRRAEPTGRTADRKPAQKSSSLVAIGGTILVVAVFAYSASQSFLYFVDSRTYAAGLPNEILMSDFSRLHPIGTGLVALLNATLLVFAFRTRAWAAALVLGSPYVLLLAFNLTKESLLMLGVFLFVVVSQKTSRLIRFAPFALFIVRPIYLVLYLLRPRTALVFCGALLVFTTVLPEESGRLWADLTRRFEDPELAQNANGREFFRGYCLEEQSSLTAAVLCLAPGLVFVPFQAGGFTLAEYTVFFTFHLGFWVVLFKTIKNRTFGMGLIFFASYFLFFFLAPTFGAFVRYFYPQIWLFGAHAFVLSDRQSTPAAEFRPRLSSNLR